MNRLITLTEDRLIKARTKKGGYRKAQLQAFGLEWPGKKGWRKDLVGTKVTLRNFIAFVIASKNKLYLEEIESLLPTLNPPIVDSSLKTPLQAFEAKQPSSKKTKLSKKELKKERTAARKAEQTAQREQRIRDYGIHKSIRLIKDKACSVGHYPDIQFINHIMGMEEPLIEFSEVRRVYNLMKKHGVILSRSRTGIIHPSGHTGIAKVRKEQFLYVIRDTTSNVCKIGISNNPKNRKSSLQTSNPNKLKISLVFDTQKNAVKVERSLHKFFRKHRKHGEWFENVSNDEIIKCLGDRAKQIENY